MAASVVPSANTGIKNAMDAAAQKREQAQQERLSAQSTTVAQAPPVSQTPVGGRKDKGLPMGFTYQADLSVAYPYGISARSASNGSRRNRSPRGMGL